MNLMESFADAQMIHSLSAGEKLIGSAITTVMGIGVTFSVLLFLWGSIALMAKFMTRYATDNRSVMTPEDNGQSINVSEHIAVIAAAVAEYEDRNSSLIIREIKRLPGRPAWSNNIIERKFSR